jgi:hypothetical protein
MYAPPPTAHTPHPQGPQRVGVATAHSAAQTPSGSNALWTYICAYPIFAHDSDQVRTIGRTTTIKRRTPCRGKPGACRHPSRRCRWTSCDCPIRCSAGCRSRAKQKRCTAASSHARRSDWNDLGSLLAARTSTALGQEQVLARAAHVTCFSPKSCISGPRDPSRHWPRMTQCTVWRLLARAAAASKIARALLLAADHLCGPLASD